jgi:type IV pilus assembly protein PilQ
MNANDTVLGSVFFRRSVSVYALCAMMALPALARQSGNPGNSPDDAQDVKVSDYGTVDISVQDTDLATVLQMLSIESKKNIITSKAVSATVSANLYDVTFHEALKAILDVNGYTFYEEGNFIYVITKEEAVAMEKARRKTESRIFELAYLSANDAKEFITPLLSENGKASARGAVQPGMKPEVTNAGADEYAFTPRLVINDYPENLQAMAELLATLDTPPQQVLVESTILQSAIDESNAFGVDFSVIGSMNFTDLTNPLAAVNNLLAGDSANGFQPADNNAGGIQSTVGNTATGPAGIKIGIVSDDISVFLRVLDEVADTTVLARPKLMALNRQRAEVLVGTKVGYLSTTSTETATTQNVQFLDTGIQLIFRPFISTDGMVRMELKPRVSEALLRDVTDSTGNIVTIPDEVTNEVTTNVRVKDGETVVLGGLFRDQTRTTRRQVPILGDIPIVGAAFRGNDDRVQRNEVIFLITPSIVHDEALWAAGEDSLQYADALRVGGRANLLPFSREKVTNNYNQKAQEAFNRGDHETALYFINNSLNLAPAQPEMIRLRELVTTERAKAHERSLMERTLRKELGVAKPAKPQASAPAPTPAPRTSPAPKSASTTPQKGTTPTPTPAPAQTSSTTPTTPTSPVASKATSKTSTTTGNQTSAKTTTKTMVEANPTTEVGVVPQSNTTTTTSTQQTNAESSTTTDPQLSSVTTEPLTPEQWMFYQQFLYNFFVSLEMPELAQDFYVEDDGTYASLFQSTSTENASTVAGVTNSTTPEN